VLAVKITVKRLSFNIFVSASRDPILSDNKQRHPRNKVKYQKGDFKKSQKRIHDNIKSLTGNGKPFVLRTVNHIRCQYQHDDPEKQQRTVDNAAPHEKSGESFNIHSFSLYRFCLWLLKIIQTGHN
jgi:hypothetical protein